MSLIESWSSADFTPPPSRQPARAADPWEQPASIRGRASPSASPELGAQFAHGPSRPALPDETTLPDGRILASGTCPTLTDSLVDEELSFWAGWLAADRTNRRVLHSRQSGALGAKEGTLKRKFDLVEFNPNARRRPWDTESADSAALLARRKAAHIVARLEVPGSGDRSAALSYLSELLEEFPSPATYQALMEQVESGIDMEVLRAVGDLRRLWLDTRAWWSRRRCCRMRQQLVFEHDPAGPHRMTWRLARQICEMRWRLPVEEMIDDDWLVEWRTFPWFVHRCWHFAQYIAWRLQFHSELRPVPCPLPDGYGASSWHDVIARRGDSW